MTYSLLAHLYPRIKGSQEDIATLSLGYLLEQSSVLNETFTRLAATELRVSFPELLTYRCQDSDDEYGRPDITGYSDRLELVCEAKFYAGLTENQPISYIRRLEQAQGKGLLFICPHNRVVSLWEKLITCLKDEGLGFEEEGDKCALLGSIRMAIISWSELLTELIRVADEKDPERHGDLCQLQGFCKKMENEAFVPFRPEDFGAQVARDIDRYYQVVDSTYQLLHTHKELNPSAKGLRKSPRWQGYSQYIRLGQFAVSIDYLRKLWKTPTSIETPFWCHFNEVNEKGGWEETDRIKKYMAQIDRRHKEDFNGIFYVALEPKPYLLLEEMAEDFCMQILDMLDKIKQL